MMVLRWWLGILSLISALTLLCSPLLYEPSLALPLDAAIVMAILLLVAGYWLVLRPFILKKPKRDVVELPIPYSWALKSALADGFFAFSVCSVALNISYMITHNMELHAEYDLMHLRAILMLASAFWEDVLCRVGNQTILWLVTVSVMDGLVGLLFGLLLSPLRKIPRSRIPVMVLFFILAILYWLFLVEREKVALFFT
ncbi:MAG: hypothetical protein EOM20_04435 [Spartobacteria bacterium]|nr:hypothetical protein [Spartobacteria bacterium]